jgi:hypothetical protein
MIVAIAHLHNFCINERLLSFNRNSEFTSSNLDLDGQERDMAANFEFEDLVLDDGVLWSHNRDRMSRKIESWQLTRPSANRC